jgi:hypothetical protein
MPFRLDHAAREIALTRWGLPECLHIPVVAVDEAAITTYIGDIERVLAEGAPRRALLIKTKKPPSIDTRLPILSCRPPLFFMNATKYGYISLLRGIATHTGRRFRTMRLTVRF